MAINCAYLLGVDPDPPAEGPAGGGRDASPPLSTHYMEVSQGNHIIIAHSICCAFAKMYIKLFKVDQY